MRYYNVYALNQDAADVMGVEVGESVPAYARNEEQAAEFAVENADCCDSDYRVAAGTCSPRVRVGDRVFVVDGEMVARYYAYETGEED